MRSSSAFIYDRKQVVDLCGTVEDPCSEPNEGLIINEPRIGWLDGSAVVVIAAHSPDQSHAAGVIAYKIRAETNQPRLVKLWQVSDPATLEAKRWFRAPLSPRWQNSGQRSHCRLAYGGMPSRYWTKNVIYLRTAVPNHENLTWIKAYRISRR